MDKPEKLSVADYSPSTITVTLGDLIFEVSQETGDQTLQELSMASEIVGRILAANGLSEETLY